MSLVFIFRCHRNPMIAAFLVAITLVFVALPAGAQTPDEHASHHPAPSDAVASPPSTAARSIKPAARG